MDFKIDMEKLTDELVAKISEDEKIYKFAAARIMEGLMEGVFERLNSGEFKQKIKDAITEEHLDLMTRVVIARQKKWILKMAESLGVNTKDLDIE